LCICALLLIKIPSWISGSAATLATVNRTLVDLRAQLGAAQRFQIEAEPARRRSPVLVHVRWACGCRAAGPGFARLDLQACATHRAMAPERRPLMRALPLIGGLLTRP